MREDAWSGLTVPSSATAVNARRVDASLPWDLFWGLDHSGRVLLMLKHSPATGPRQRLPRLRDIEVASETLPEGVPVLVLRLQDGRLRDVFQRLCDDIASSIRRCSTEAEAVDAAVGRTWRWHHLLRGGGGGLLRPEEQKGLIGELLVLEHHLLPVVGAEPAVAAWRGPLSAPQDFVHGSVAVESKATSTSDSGSVIVSSEAQLSEERYSTLFLHLSVLDPADPDTAGSFTVTEVAARVRATLAAAGENVVLRVDALFSAAGFRPEDDYSDYAWTGGERSIYRVAGAFPRLTAANIPPGVSEVSYTVRLPLDDTFLVSPRELHEALSGSGA
jgi:hypothetical protein